MVSDWPVLIHYFNFIINRSIDLCNCAMNGAGFINILLYYWSSSFKQWNKMFVQNIYLQQILLILPVEVENIDCTIFFVADY